MSFEEIEVPEDNEKDLQYQVDDIIFLKIKTNVMSMKFADSKFDYFYTDIDEKSNTTIKYITYATADDEL